MPPVVVLHPTADSE